MASYRYWRVKVTAAPGAYVACSTLAFRTAYCGDQVAVGGTAIADSAFSGLPASNAFDTVGTTLWACNGTGTNAWLGYDFGSPIEINEMVWTARRDAGYTQIWSTATVDGSTDGSSWTTVASLTAAAWHQGMSQTFTVQGAGPDVSTPGTGSHRYWRVPPTALLSSANGGFACSELIWRTAAAGAQVATGGTPLSESNAGTTNPATVYNGDTTSQWATNGTGIHGWIGYDFGAATHIAEIAYYPYDADQNFTTAEVQSSDDNVNWSAAAHITAGTWTAGSGQTFTIQAAGAPAAVVRPVVFICC